MRRAGSTFAKVIIASTLLLPSVMFRGQDTVRFVTLPSSAIAAAPAMKGTVFGHGNWTPSKADIDGIEAHLPDVAALRDGMWGPKVERRIDHPERYHRKYVPVVVSGKRLIYGNAFCEAPPANWHDHLLVVADGATCYWQVLYDQSMMTFSHLAINARA